MAQYVRGRSLRLRPWSASGHRDPSSRTRPHCLSARDFSRRASHGRKISCGAVRARTHIPRGDSCCCPDGGVAAAPRLAPTDTQVKRPSTPVATDRSQQLLGNMVVALPTLIVLGGMEGRRLRCGESHAVPTAGGEKSSRLIAPVTSTFFSIGNSPEVEANAPLVPTLRPLIGSDRRRGSLGYVECNEKFMEKPLSWVARPGSTRGTPAPGRASGSSRHKWVWVTPILLCRFGDRHFRMGHDSPFWLQQAKVRNLR